jgi:ubiquinone biosynthesis monooxygenase Coq7
MQAAWLASGETIGDRILRVDHCGEHGAVRIYLAQRWMARWRAPGLVAEIDGFIAHERGHRALFAAELARRGRARCLNYLLCGWGGLVLGSVTGLLGPRAIAATTVAVKAVVLRHLAEQLDALAGSDPAAADVVRAILADEQEHHDRSAERLRGGMLEAAVRRVVTGATEAVIWMGMRSPV